MARHLFLFKNLLIYENYALQPNSFDFCEIEVNRFVWHANKNIRPIESPIFAKENHIFKTAKSSLTKQIDETRIIRQYGLLISNQWSIKSYLAAIGVARIIDEKAPEIIIDFNSLLSL